MFKQDFVTDMQTAGRVVITLSKAAFVGANIVKICCLSRVSSRSAAFRAVYRVEKCSFSLSAWARVFPTGLIGLWVLVGTS